ncbi:MAG TPA: pyruvate kinase, partial [Mariniphaga sp.]|nr:pyruvate kinase [Mariniphaga sp.]
MRKTKIVATLSDFKSTPDFIQALYDAGMNVARLNTAHLNIEAGKKLIDDIRSVSENIAILIDTKGPEIRTCSVQTDLQVAAGQEVRFAYADLPGLDIDVCVNHIDFVSDLNPGNRILIDDGAVAVTVTGKTNDFLTCV